MANLKHTIFDDIDDVFDERGTTFIALRKIHWTQDDKEPDPEKAKLELRKWRMQEDGSEWAMGGFSFLTPEGPHELAKLMVSRGYGHTKDILCELKKRDDFKESVEHMFDENSESAQEYFDMREMMLREAPSAGSDEEDENE